MPVNLVYSHIDKIEINASVLDLNNKAVTVNVETLDIVLQPQSKEDWENIENVFTDYEMKRDKAEQLAANVFN
jgi:hypothetical protein